MLDLIMDLLDLIYDFILEPVSEYRRISLQEGEERGQEAMVRSFTANALVWGFFVFAGICLVSWQMRNYFLLVPAAVGLAWISFCGLRRIIAYFREC